MSIRDQIDSFQKELNDIQRDYDRAKGKHQGHLDALKDIFGVTTLAGAKNLLKQMKEDVQRKEKDLDKAVEKFQEDYL